MSRVDATSAPHRRSMAQPAPVRMAVINRPTHAPHARSAPRLAVLQPNAIGPGPNVTPSTTHSPTSASRIRLSGQLSSRFPGGVQSRSSWPER